MRNRRKYSRNDEDVLLEYVRNLKEEKAVADRSDDLSFILNSKRNKMREDKNKKS